jgi:hypothetical protein
VALPDRARSFVDLTTNEMLVSDFDLAEYLAWVRGRPVAGSRVLANFLHEWTHRWCFHSPVGSAIALLRMRAACRAYLGRSARDDHVRCMTAGTILEPLAEGLALFAEFDTYPGKSRWMSQTLTTSLLFFAPAVETDGNPLLLLQGLLQTLRRDPLLLERKAGIYAQPVNVSNPYLVGYLSVRSLWCQMAAACSELNDRDLFLSYLRSYFYDDPGMVLHILDAYPSELHASGAIVNHLLSRIRGLVSFDGLSQRVEQWIRSAENGHVDVASIGANATDEQRANQMIERAIVADVSDDVTQTFAAWMLMTLEERRVCVIASTAVGLKPQPTADRIDIVVQGVSEPVSSVAADSIPDAREGELMIVASSDGHATVVLLRVDKNVTVLSSSKFNEAELELAKRHAANRPTSASLHEKFRANLKSSTEVELVWELVMKRVTPAMKELFGPLATLNAKEADWTQAFTELEREGLFGMLEHDGELMRALAVIGLVNTFSTHVGMIRMMGKMLDVDDKSLERAISLVPRHGLPLVARKGDSVMALV